MTNKNEKINSSGYENIINNNNINKTQKYSKKIIQEGINKKTNEKKNRNLFIKRRLKNLSIDSQGVPVLSENNNLEEINDDNNIDDIIDDYQTNNLLEDIFESNKVKKRTFLKLIKYIKVQSPLIQKMIISQLVLIV
jgi:hypothetical protein